MIDDERQRLIAEALDEFDGALDYDGCDCGETCTNDHPMCNWRRVVATVERLKKVVFPTVTTLHPDRLSNPAERIYYEAAQSLTERVPFLDSGWSTIEHILNPQLRNSDRALSPSPPPVPTARDCQVIGTFCQWLGTNCGLSWMRAVERKIEESRAERQDWGDYMPPYMSTRAPWCDIQAAELLSHVVGPETRGHQFLQRRISYVLRQFLAIVAYVSGKVSGDDAAGMVSMQPDQFRKMAQKAIEKSSELHQAHLEAAQT